MLVYRVEDKKHPREGAFNVGCADNAREQANREGVFNFYHHPVPSRDPGLMRYPNEREHCGFPSLDVYRTWFVTPGVRAALYEEGTHHMRVYDVPDHLVAVGMLQCLFRLEDATSVRVATPEEFN